MSINSKAIFKWCVTFLSACLIWLASSKYPGKWLDDVFHSHATQVKQNIDDRATVFKLYGSLINDAGEINNKVAWQRKVNCRLLNKPFHGQRCDELPLDTNLPLKQALGSSFVKSKNELVANFRQDKKNLSLGLGGIAARRPGFFKTFQQANAWLDSHALQLPTLPVSDYKKWEKKCIEKIG